MIRVGMRVDHIFKLKVFSIEKLADSAHKVEMHVDGDSLAGLLVADDPGPASLRMLKGNDVQIR